MSSIPDASMGDVWPAIEPGPDGADYGQSTLAPTGRFEVRSFQTFTLTYHVGPYGLDDTGAIQIVHRWTDDGGRVQCHDPAARNYVTATASNGVALELFVEPYPHRRPWYNGLRITVKRGFMSEGDTITVTYGDRSGGGPGHRLQTFCETGYAFKVLADVCATGVFLPVGDHQIDIVAGPPVRWAVVAPTLRRVGEPFALGIRGEDAWGNATEIGPKGLCLAADGPVTGLPQTLPPRAPGARGTRIEGLRIDAPGTTRFVLRDADGRDLARSNPLVITEAGPASYWGDLHGQSGETVGINPIEDYLRFARDVGFLDVTSHQANDFQVTNAFWQQINAVSADLNTDGRFVVFPGYEWSGNTPVGGDHNVFFASEDEQIHRSSHALLRDRSDLGSDAPTLEALFGKLEDRDCVLYAHIGGRPADIARAEHARLRTAVEVHSDWGTFEWVMGDAFDLGYRVGLVSNSDGHKGAPGCCYPGASEFGAYGGLTCFIAPELTRPAIFRAMRARHHYGTTGCRMHLEVSAALGPQGGLYPVDPRIAPGDPVPADRAMMGDIAVTGAPSVALDIRLDTHAPIERVEVLNAMQVVQTLRPYKPDPTGRLRVLWEGAEYRGRGRTTHWQGRLDLDRARIVAMRKINIWNLDRRFEQAGPGSVTFDAVTTGNYGGMDLWLDSNDGMLAIETGLVSGRFALADITAAEVTLDAGGLDRRIRLMRLPARLETCHLEERVDIPLAAGRDNPLWVRVQTEDGFTGWSSPIYLIP